MVVLREETGGGARLSSLVREMAGRDPDLDCTVHRVQVDREGVTVTADGEKMGPEA